MSFSFNGPSFRPMIQESQSMKNNGGGGNTGYYKRGKKKKEKAVDVFTEAQEQDKFVPEEAENIEPPEKFLDKIIEKTKGIVKKVTETTQKPQNNPFEPLIDEETEE